MTPERLIRPPAGASREEHVAFASAIAAALKRLGVEPGGEFFISTLGGVARARTGDPTTSHAAAASVDDLRGSQRAILSVFKMTNCEAMTDETLIERYAGLVTSGDAPQQSPSGIRSRRAELVGGGHLVDTKRTAKLRSGRKAVLWALPSAVEPETGREMAERVGAATDDIDAAEREDAERREPALF
jgi:hypothetical protein